MMVPEISRSKALGRCPPGGIRKLYCVLNFGDFPVRVQPSVKREGNTSAVRAPVAGENACLSWPRRA
ncbi:MAG: hypothetical protein JW395_2962 [Nitrospira sp.]|nr:hypothetical protein [Nitrospira sp.]